MSNTFAHASQALPISGTGAIIGNGYLILGVNNAGHLNVDYRALASLGLPASDPALIGKVGLRNGGGDLPSIEPECLCEGWGIASPETGQSGYANEGLGSGNIEVLSFIGSDGDDSAKSYVLAYNRLEVTHDYHPSDTSSYLYEVLVTVKNVGEFKLNSTLYRRVMDWDSYPTPLIEFVTIKGTGATPNLVGSGNNGFLTSDILSSTSYGTGLFGALSINADFEDFGPDDQGSVFDFELGTLAPGESTTIRTFYGVAPDEQAALAALNAVGAQLHSFGQSNENGAPNNDGTTFIYAFASDGVKARQEHHADFNGDSYEDLVVGVPNEDIGSVADAGAVNVIYGSPDGLSTSANPDQLFHQNFFGIEGIAQPGDHFGSARASGDFNNDGFDDLAIGVPGKDLGTKEDAGAVNVLFGSASGLSVSNTIAAQILNKQVQELDGDIASFDHFGYSLAAGDLNNDGFDDLAIGSPIHIRSDSLVGATVNIIYGSVAGLSVTNPPDQMLTNADIGFASSLTTGDFNNDKFDDLAIGDPSADLVNGHDAGTVFILHGSPSGLAMSYGEILHQEDLGFFSSDSERFGSILAAGDFNNDKFDDLAIGAGTEESSQFTGGIYVPNMGTVSVIYGSSSGLRPSLGGNPEPQLWNQNSAGIKGTGEEGDNFARALSAGDFNGDGYVDLAVGVPGENIAATDDAGAVNIIYGASSGLKAGPTNLLPSTGLEDQLWNQNSSSVRATAETRDYFGQSLTIGDFNNDGYWDLAIGVPGEDLDNNATLDTGMVNVIYGSSEGLDAQTISNQGWHQNTPLVEGLSDSGDNFGLVLLTDSI